MYKKRAVSRRTCARNIYYNLGMNPLIPLGALLVGIVLIIFGLIKRGSANEYKAIPCSPITGLRDEERAFITGTATSPVHTRAPVSGESCVFYLEVVDRVHRDHGGRSGSMGHNHKSRVSEKAYGGFLVKDGSGSALVVPHYGTLDLNKPETVKDDSLIDTDGSMTRTESVINEGETVTVLGRPRPLSDFMRYMRGNSGLDIPAAFLEQLLKLEAGEEGSSMMCFFGQGVEKVSDVAHADYVAGTANSASFLLKLGAALAVSGAGFFLYLLKAAAPDTSGL